MNRFKPIEVSITLRDSKIVLKRVSWIDVGEVVHKVDVKVGEGEDESDEERWGGVQARVLVQQRDLEQHEADQDEDEVNLLIRIPN